MKYLFLMFNIFEQKHKNSTFKVLKLNSLIISYTVEYFRVYLITGSGSTYWFNYSAWIYSFVDGNIDNYENWLIPGDLTNKTVNNKWGILIEGKEKFINISFSYTCKEALQMKTSFYTFISCIFLMIKYQL